MHRPYSSAGQIVIESTAHRSWSGFSPKPMPIAARQPVAGAFGCCVG